MKQIDLFTGMGGFLYAGAAMGWEPVAWVEKEEFLHTPLRYHFPEATGYGDIKKTDFTPYANRIDIVTGGFPCQPYSVSGLRKGTEDDRNLWPDFYEAICIIQPPYVVAENVRGLLNWNGGLVFDEITNDLEAAGYEVMPFLLPAGAVGAGHQRERLWIVAHSAGARLQRRHAGTQKEWQSPERSVQALVADTDWPGKAHRAVLDGVYGLPAGLAHCSVRQWENQCIKAAGNSIVPQVALEIFKAIEQTALKLYES